MCGTTVKTDFTLTHMLSHAIPVLIEYWPGLLEVLLYLGILDTFTHHFVYATVCVVAKGFYNVDPFLVKCVVCESVSDGVWLALELNSPTLEPETVWKLPKPKLCLVCCVYCRAVFTTSCSDGQHY